MKYVFYKIDEWDNIWFLEYAENEGDVFQGSSNYISDVFTYYSSMPVSPIEGYEPVELSLAQVMLF